MILSLTLLMTLYSSEGHSEAEQQEKVATVMVPAAPAESRYALLDSEEYCISTYDNLMREISREEGTDWRLMSAIAYHESRFTPDIVSPRGAKGLMQIMPVVARQFNTPQEELLDPVTNVRLANLLYKKLDKMLGLPAGTPHEERMSLVLAAYNGGIGHVSDARRLARLHGENPNSWAVVARYLELKAQPDYYTHRVVKCGRFTGYRQTQAYVRDVMSRYRRYCSMTEA